MSTDYETIHELLEILKSLVYIVKDHVADPEDWHDYQRAIAVIAQNRGCMSDHDTIRELLEALKAIYAGTVVSSNYQSIVINISHATFKSVEDAIAKAEAS